MNRASNSVATSAVALAPPPHPPQPHRPSTSCDLHPEERFSGFCPSCLFNRLSLLEIPTKNATAASSSKKPPSSSAALKSTVKPTSSGTGTSQRVTPGLFTELRRTKSFSSGKNEVLSLSAFEPQRRSCDVRVRNTLWSLFNDDFEHNSHKKFDFTDRDDAGGGFGEIELEPRNYRVRSPDHEEKTDSQSKHDEKEPRRSVIEPVDEIVEVEIKCNEREEERRKAEEQEQMEENPQTKKPNRDFKDIAGSFWSAASVFSKKLQKWRQKQKFKKHRNGRGIGSAALPVEKSIGRQMRDTQSEIADYGFGRRSCDTDPRFSIDAGRFSLDAGRISLDAARVSVDDHRYSFDEPRASWDGYLIGRTAAPPRMPSMLSVVEDSPIHNHTLQSDRHIPVEEPAQPLDENIPGGSVQTREYYSDSSGRRRKSLDRCSSTRKTAASVMAESDELKLATSSNTKLSPGQDRDPKHSHSQRSYSLRDDCSVENLEIGFPETTGIVDSKKEMKKSRRWNWNIFKLLNRKNGNKYEEDGDERFSSNHGRNGVERTFSDDPRMMRSNSSVSWRSSGNFTRGEFQRNSVDGFVSKKKGKNGRNVENGTLKFYLTPTTGNRRGNGTGTNLVPASRPIPRNVMKI